jgi:hypothetical protein
MTWHAPLNIALAAVNVVLMMFHGPLPVMTLIFGIAIGVLIAQLVDLVRWPAF